MLRNSSDVFVLPRHKVEAIRQQQDDIFARLGIPVGSDGFNEGLRRFAAMRRKQPELSPDKVFQDVLASMVAEGLINPVEEKVKEKFSLKNFFLGRK